MFGSGPILFPEEDARLKLNDHVAVITGGASGLGRATAEMVVNGGGKVAIFDLNEDLGRQTAAELGNDTRAYKVDVVDEASTAEAVRQVIADFGGIHINVNCAGIGAAARTIGKDGPLPLQNFNFVIQVNLIGADTETSNRL